GLLLRFLAGRVGEQLLGLTLVRLVRALLVRLLGPRLRHGLGRGDQHGGADDRGGQDVGTEWESGHGSPAARIGREDHFAALAGRVCETSRNAITHAMAPVHTNFSHSVVYARRRAPVRRSAAGRWRANRARRCVPWGRDGWTATAAGGCRRRRSCSATGPRPRADRSRPGP